MPKVEYPARAKLRALELKEAGWGLDRIVALVREELDIQVSRSCVATWVMDPKKAQRMNARKAKAKRKAWDKKNPGRRCRHCGGIVMTRS